MKIASTHAEDHFLPLQPGTLLEVRRGLRSRGYGRAKVAGVLDFLVARDHGDELPDGASQNRYRKMLFELVEHGPDGAQETRTMTRATPGYLSSALGRRRRRRELEAQPDEFSQVAA